MAAASTGMPQPFTPDAGDPSATLNVPGDRDAWIALDPNRYMEMCTQSEMSGNFEYVKTALRAVHEGMTHFIIDRDATGMREVTPGEAYQMLQLQQKMNAMLLTMINRNARVERDARTLVTRVQAVESTASTIQEIAKLTDAITK